MDDPVTDIAFVSDVAHCPKGYTLITECPCGHEAQLWEKVLGGVDATRYLCFTKDNDADEIIEAMYIPSAGSRYLYKGFEVIHKTVEDETPLRHKQLAIKKVSRKSATKAIADVMVCRSKDKVSKLYKQTEKVNGLRICHRIVDYKYTPPRGATASSLNQRFEALSVYEQQPGRMRSSSDIEGESSTTPKKTESQYRPSPPTSPLDDYVPKINDPPTAPPKSSSDNRHPIDLYNYTPSPDLSGGRKPVVEEAVQVATVQSLASAPPPSTLQQSGTPPTASEVDGSSIPSATVPPTTTQSYVLPPVSSYPSTNPFSQAQSTTLASAYQQPAAHTSYPSTVNPTNTYPQQHYPPPAAHNQGGYGQQNPPPGTYPPYNPMQPRPTGSYYQSQTYPSTTPAYGFAGAPSGGYPPQQVGGYNYSSVVGSSFGQVSYDPYQRGSAGTGPFNPYHQQGTHPPAPTAGGNAPYPPPGTAPATTNSSSYGFKF